MISANLAGIDIRTLLVDETKFVDFGEIGQINNKLKVWNDFRKSGNRTLEDRDEWVQEIFGYVQEAVQECGNTDVTTIRKLYETSHKDSYISGLVMPFLNIKIDYNGDYLCGLYEYFGEHPFSDSSIYYDFLIQDIYNYAGDDEEFLAQVEKRAKEILKSKDYNLIGFNEGMATIEISRKLLNNGNAIKEKLITLINDAVLLNDEISKLLEEQ